VAQARPKTVERERTPLAAHLRRGLREGALFIFGFGAAGGQSRWSGRRLVRRRAAHAVRLPGLPVSDHGGLYRLAAVPGSPLRRPLRLAGLQPAERRFRAHPGRRLRSGQPARHGRR